jgi:hypothetical protein
MKVEIKCEAKDRIAMEDLTEFQGNLKNLDEPSFRKLRNKILVQGFSFPIFVWKSEDGNNFILDGHQRLRVLQALKKEGYEIPEIPVAIVHADSYKEAKEKLLSAASQFGDIEGQGLYEYITENSMEPDYVLENFKMAGFDVDRFMAEYYQAEVPNYGDKNEEIPEEEFSKFQHTCPKCGFMWDGDKKR